jgi:Rrf2 family iron-sulfur cluster assembly transcriptional regulator
VQGVRGPGGGYQLRLLPEQVSISMIMDAVNEPIDSTRCRGEANCQHEGTCLTHDLWIDLNEHIEAYLAKITLADLLHKREERQRTEQSSERILVMKKARS